MKRRLLFGIQTIFSENPCGVFFPVETTEVYRPNYFFLLFGYEETFSCIKISNRNTQLNIPKLQQMKKRLSAFIETQSSEYT